MRKLLLGLVVVVAALLTFLLWPGASQPIEPVGEASPRREGVGMPGPADLVAETRGVTSGHAQEPVTAKDQQYKATYRGEYGIGNKTIESVYGEIAGMILSWVPDEAEFHRRNLGWKVDDQKWSSTIPFTQLAADDFQLDTQALEAANSVAADYEERLRQASATAWELLNHYADVYARQHAEKRPRAEAGKKSRRVGWDGPPEGAPRYSSEFAMPAGKWVFEVYFSSTDFPELQRALVEVEDIQKEREQAVRRVLR